MQDQRVTEILRELPREQARPGFTTRVLARLDEPQPRWRWQPRLAVAAFAAVLVLTLGVAWQQQREQALRKAEAKRLLEELRAEHSQLEQELREIAEPPVIYLGGDEDVDLVVDMGRVQDADGIEPASLRYDTF